MKNKMNEKITPKKYKFKHKSKKNVELLRKLRCEVTVLLLLQKVAGSGAHQKEPPSTVAEWLHDLDMEQYVQVFMEQGWDHLDFLHLLTDPDLVNLGVLNPTHRQMILNRIGQMKQ